MKKQRNVLITKIEIDDGNVEAFVKWGTNLTITDLTITVEMQVEGYESKVLGKNINREYISIPEWTRTYDNDLINNFYSYGYKYLIGNGDMESFKRDLITENLYDIVKENLEELSYAMEDLFYDKNVEEQEETEFMYGFAENLKIDADILTE